MQPPPPKKKRYNYLPLYVRQCYGILCLREDVVFMFYYCFSIAYIAGLQQCSGVALTCNAYGQC